MHNAPHRTELGDFENSCNSSGSGISVPMKFSAAHTMSKIAAIRFIRT